MISLSWLVVGDDTLQHMAGCPGARTGRNHAWSCASLVSWYLVPVSDTDFILPVTCCTHLCCAPERGCEMRVDPYPSSSSSSATGSSNTSRRGSESSLLSDKSNKMSAIYGYSRSLVPRRKIDTPSSEVITVDRCFLVDVQLPQLLEMSTCFFATQDKPNRNILK